VRRVQQFLLNLSCNMLLFLTILTGFLSLSFAQTYLRADGSKDAYKLINSVLGGNAVEAPDCAHKSFGQHIRQENDQTLNRPVFLFYIHVNPDNDRCSKFDRQRNEIKTYGPSPGHLKGRRGENVSFSWNFLLDAGFQPSGKFTHIHQIKGGDGDSGSPILTITPRYNSKGNRMELIHVDSKGKKTLLKATDLKGFLGTWIHVTERITYDTNGKYSVTLSSLETGNILLEYNSSKIDFWRRGATFVRPKWGIYRSLDDKNRLRDEIVRFDTFCLGKGKQSCE